MARTATASLARTSYRLACWGPLAFLVRALAYPQTDPTALPPLPEQVLWWGLCGCAPAGALLGSFALARASRTGRAGFNHGAAAVAVGLLASLALFYGTRHLDAMRLNNRPGSRTSCSSNLKQLSLGAMMYAQDYDERLPHAAWNSGLMPYVRAESLFHCPAELDHSVPSYAFHWRLIGVARPTVREPAKAVMLFESVPGRDLTGNRMLLPDPPRHGQGHVIGFLDSHVKFVPPAEFAALNWKPVIEPLKPAKKPPAKPAKKQAAPPKKRK